MFKRRPNRVSVARAFREWWANSVREKGISGTCRELAARLAELLRDSTPERRRRRYGDVEYDWDHRVDTTAATVGFRNRLLGVFHSHYQASEPALFHEMLSGLNIDYRQFVLIDLGSGKGRTLLMASDYPFLRIVGVELLPELHAIAQENVSRYNGEHQRCFAIETVLTDARGYEFPIEPLVVYLFNPFARVVLQTVLARLEDSVRRAPRPVYLLYHNPLLEDVLARQCVFRKMKGTLQYVIYSNAS